MNQLLKNKVFKNASWIIGCRVAQAVLSFIVTMLTARFLGPSNYGVINYAASIVAFVAPIAQLGLGNIQVQELVNDPDNEGKIVGTTIGMSLISAVFCVAGVTAFSLIANASEKETIIVCVLYSLILFFQSAELLQYWFQAKYISKYASISSLIAFTIVTAYRVFLLVKGKSVYWFAVVNGIDYVIITIALLYLYRRIGGQKLEFSFFIAKRMLAKSRYYIVANMMVAIFTQTDHIMLKIMLDNEATGLYSAAISCAGLASFIYAAIIDSYRPLIFENYHKSKVYFENSMSQLYSIVIYLSLFQCIVVTLLAKPMIMIIYGSAYIESVNALKISVWYTTFSFIGTIRNIWILAEEKQKWLWLINFSGAAANVILNYIFIPMWGIMGAAFASLITQFFANVVISYLIPEIRRNTYIMIKGLNIKLIFCKLKKMRKY